MTNPRLPERPNLEQLKRQAKDLLRAARAHDPAALARFRTLPAFARIHDDDRVANSVALHDAQSVVARELGFPSWNALAQQVEELTLDFSSAVNEFIAAATEVRPDRAERLLRLHPRIAAANAYTALLLGDIERVKSHLREHPEFATASSGPRNWPPLLYVCHTGLGFGDEGRPDRLVEIARRLLDAGADPNARYPWLHHGVQRAALWGAVCETRLLPLADVLLDGGADPNDGVTLPLSASGGDIAALELLRAHGADVDQPWATDGSATVYAILTWGGTNDGVRWLLDHGANPDPVFAENGETPLHVVARRWDAATADLFVKRGVDVRRRRADGRTPYAVAELNGNRDVAEYLEAHAGATELSAIDRLVAACSRGDLDTVQSMLRARPELPSELRAEHYGAWYRAAERGDVKAIEAMVRCGFDVNRGDDEIGKTALHAAAHDGHADAVRVLLAHGASVSARDREFHGQPLVWAADGARSHSADGREYDAVGRMLLDAGSPTDWQQGEEPSDVILDIIDGWRRLTGGAPPVASRPATPPTRRA